MKMANLASFKWDWTDEEKKFYAPDVEEPTNYFHDNWRIIYYKFLEARKELFEIKGENRQLGIDKDLVN